MIALTRQEGMGGVASPTGAVPPPDRPRTLIPSLSPGRTAQVGQQQYAALAATPAPNLPLPRVFQVLSRDGERTGNLINQKTFIGFNPRLFGWRQFWSKNIFFGISSLARLCGGWKAFTAGAAIGGLSLLANVPLHGFLPPASLFVAAATAAFGLFFYLPRNLFFNTENAQKWREGPGKKIVEKYLKRAKELQTAVADPLKDVLAGKSDFFESIIRLGKFENNVNLFARVLARKSRDGEPYLTLSKPAQNGIYESLTGYLRPIRSVAVDGLAGFKSQYFHLFNLPGIREYLKANSIDIDKFDFIFNAIDSAVARWNDIITNQKPRYTLAELDDAYAAAFLLLDQGDQNVGGRSSSGRNLRQPLLKELHPDAFSLHEVMLHLEKARSEVEKKVTADPGLTADEKVKRLEQLNTHQAAIEQAKSRYAGDIEQKLKVVGVGNEAEPLALSLAKVLDPIPMEPFATVAQAPVNFFYFVGEAWRRTGAPLFRLAAHSSSWVFSTVKKSNQVNVPTGKAQLFQDDSTRALNASLAPFVANFNGTFKPSLHGTRVNNEQLEKLHHFVYLFFEAGHRANGIKLSDYARLVRNEGYPNIQEHEIASLPFIRVERHAKHGDLIFPTKELFELFGIY